MKLSAVFGTLLAFMPSLPAEDAGFHRAINLGGPAINIDGRTWEAGAMAPDFKTSGTVFEEQKVPLPPPPMSPAAAWSVAASTAAKWNSPLPKFPPGQSRSSFMFKASLGHARLRGNIVSRKLR
jgi:hypothetical protein